MFESDSISLITSLMNRIRCPRSQKAPRVTENQCVNGSPLKQKPECPSPPPSSPLFPGQHKNHIPFERYMSLTG